MWYVPLDTATEYGEGYIQLTEKLQSVAAGSGVDSSSASAAKQCLASLGPSAKIKPKSMD